MGQRGYVPARELEGAGYGTQTRSGHSFIHSLNKYLLNTCYVQGTVMGDEDIAAIRR